MSGPSTSPATREFSRADFRVGGLAQLARAALVMLVVMYPPLILALSGGLIWLAWTLVTLRIPYFYLYGTALVAVLLALALLCSLVMLLWRLRNEPPCGIVLRPQNNPAVFELIRRIARRLGADPPGVVLMQAGGDAAIGYYDVQDAGRRSREHVLMLGVLNVLVCNAAEFAALICHEIAHAAAWDTLVSRGVWRFYMAMGAALCIHDPHDHGDSPLLARIVHLPLLGYFYLFTLLYLYDCRQREWRADRIAAAICGPQRTRDLLRKVHRLAKLPELDVGRLAEDAASRDNPPDSVYDVFRERCATLSPRRWDAVENEAFMEPRSVWSTHPNLADRFRRLAKIEAPELPAQRPACDLFLDWKRIEREMSAVLLAAERVRLRQLDRELDRVVRC